MLDPDKLCGGKDTTDNIPGGWANTAVEINHDGIAKPQLVQARQLLRRGLVFLSVAKLKRLEHLIANLEQWV